MARHEWESRPSACHEVYTLCTSLTRDPWKSQAIRGSYIHSLPGLPTLGTCLPIYRQTTIVASIDPRKLATYLRTYLRYDQAQSARRASIRTTSSIIILEQFNCKVQMAIVLCHLVCFRRATPRDRPRMPQITTAKDFFPFPNDGLVAASRTNIATIKGEFGILDVTLRVNHADILAYRTASDMANAIANFKNPARLWLVQS